MAQRRLCATTQRQYPQVIPSHPTKFSKGPVVKTLIRTAALALPTIVANHAFAQAPPPTNLARAGKQFPEQKVVTPILMASTFYPIKGKESYHQDYYKTNSVRYKYYRWRCGRDQRLKEIWGDQATH